MRRTCLVASLGALLLAAFGVAGAQNAFTSRPMNVRAGPNRDYPLVAQLDQGAPLDVHGCLNDWSWCDVSFENTRGWIYAGGVSFVYQGGQVPLFSYGPRLGLPILTFSLLTYWGDYYQDRPWYAQRTTWVNRRMPPHTVPRGRPQMSHSRPAASARPAPRAQQRGHGAPAQRSMQRQPPHAAAPARGGSRPSGHAPAARGGHGNEPQQHGG